MKRILSISFAFWLTTSPLLWAAGAFVQVKALATDGTAADKIAVTPDSDVAQGELVAVGFGWGTSDVTPTCAGSRAGSLTLVQKNWDAGRGGFGMCYGIEPSAGAETITVTFGSSVAYRAICAAIYSGVRSHSPFDTSDYKQQVAPGNGANAVTTDNMTVAANNALIFGFSIIAALDTTYTAGTNYTSRANGNAATTLVDFMCEDRLNVTAGTHAATWTSGTTGVDTQSGAMAFFDTTGVGGNNLLLLGVGQ